MKHFREWLIPELVRVPDEDRRLAAFRHATSKVTIESAHFILGAFILIVVLTPYVLTMTSPKSSFRAILDPLYQSWVIFIAFSPLAAVCFIFQRSHVRRKARAYLREHGLPICDTCGYDLIGNTSGVCPECGTAVLSTTVANLSTPPSFDEVVMIEQNKPR